MSNHTSNFSLSDLVENRRGDTYKLFNEHINPQFGKVLRTIGFDRNYVKGERSYLYDADGTRYLDFLSGYGMFNIGRNHPVMKKAIRDYLDLDDPWKVQMGATLLSGLLAEKLKEKTPHLDKVTFTNSGTECTEAALKYARCSTGRERVLYFNRAFHGLSYGSLSLNGCNSFRDGFVSFLPGAQEIPFDNLEILEHELKREPVAALVFETIQGKGVYSHKTQYLQKAQELCRHYGTLFVADEVQCGLGRTGKFFAYQHHEGIEPDIVLVSKSLSGGMVPVGAVLMKQKVYEGVFSTMDRCVVHSSTFAQGGLAMACGLAALHIIEEEKLVLNAADKGKKLIDGLNDMANRYELIREVRGQGLIIAMELGPPSSWMGKSAWNMMHSVDGGLFPQAIIMPALEKHHILTQVSGHHQDIIKILPPLIITDEDVQWFLSAMDTIVKDCNRSFGPIWTTASHLMRFATTSRT